MAKDNTQTIVLAAAVLGGLWLLSRNTASAAPANPLATAPTYGGMMQGTGGPAFTQAQPAAQRPDPAAEVITSIGGLFGAITGGIADLAPALRKPTAAP